ncbi:hypothetical protein LTR81_028152 [Elasticomyces elasticus]
MTVDSELYEVLEVLRRPRKIKSGRHTRELCWRLPHKAPQDAASQHDASKRFSLVQRAYEILGNEDRRQEYDTNGLEGVVHEPGELERARRAFEKFQPRDVDPAQKELLERWNRPDTPSLGPAGSLQVQSEDYLGALRALYEQFRLTHSRTTGDDLLSRPASADSNKVRAILKVASEHFGEQNANKLRAWNANGSLDPMFDRATTATRCGVVS